MLKPELSIIMPGIRPQNWERAYNSAYNTNKTNFELIIISPFVPSQYLLDHTNVKFIRDFGSPTRATCIGSLLAEGKYIFPTMADDAVFIDGAIDKNLEVLKAMGDRIHNVVVAKYSESQGFSHKERYQDDEYYKLVNSYPVNKETCPKEWWIFNTCFLHTQYFIEMGGYDASLFEAACMAHSDFAIRAQHGKAIVKMSDFPILQCDHIPSGGDHTPIEIAQIQYDTPKFKTKYGGTLNYLNHTIDLMNWKNSETIWSKRFQLK